MASTKPTYAVDIITNIGTTPEERAITTAQFKAKFDETNAAQKAWEIAHCDENDAEFALKAPLASPTFTGVVTAPTNTSYTTRQVRNVVLSTSDPSGGSNGDIWFKYTP
jgi:hypothetical protein